MFRNWQMLLAPDIEVCGVQLPGRENRLSEPHYQHLSNLVEELSRQIGPYLNMPFVFFGHSMGALIGFALAREIRARYDRLPVHLFVSARPAPHLPPKRPPIYHLPDEKFVEEIRRLNGTSNEVLKNRELMELLLPTLRADMTICETYEYTADEPLNCPITAFGGRRDEYVSAVDLDAWRDHTCAEFRREMLPGDHFFLKNTERKLADAVAQAVQGRQDLQCFDEGTAERAVGPGN